MRSMAAVYATANSSHPLATKSVISGGLLGAADVACQQSEAAPSAIDWARTARMAAWGLLVNGPSGHTFYRALDKWVRGSTASAIATKIAVDQLLYTPPLTAGFFGFMSLGAGCSSTEAMHVVRRETWPTLLYNWSFWGVAHIVTFAAIPLEHRVAWVAAKNFVWSCFLSWRLGNLDGQQSLETASSTSPAS